jgi:hypothetical protein
VQTPNASIHSSLLALRWLARISSILLIGVFVLMFIGEGFDPARITPREWVSLLFFPFGLVLGMALAWWREGLGGAITLASLLGFAMFGDLSQGACLPSLLCASPGFLFLLCWFLSKAEKMPAGEEGLPQPSAPAQPGPGISEAVIARVAAGLCPKCGAQVKPAAQNCPSCRINLAFAREHLDQLSPLAK